MFIIQDLQIILKEIEELRKEVSILRLRVIELEEENRELREENKELREENTELKRRLSQNSNNSSKPPSSDPPWIKSSRKKGLESKKSKRKTGGQPGHKGNKLTKFNQVDHYIKHQLSSCPRCQNNKLEFKEIKKRQVADIPIPKMDITEHHFYSYHCECCGERFESPAIKNFSQEVQYGPRIKTLVSYLNVYQLIPYKRLVEVISDLYGHQISQGSISNFNKELSDKLSGFIAKIKECFQDENQIFHSDETGCRVASGSAWLHVYSDRDKTLLEGHERRGKIAMDEIGVLPQAKGTVIHDRFGSYFGYDQLNHGLCNAHILRELTALQETTDLEWPGQIKALLKKSYAKKKKGAISKISGQRYKNKFMTILRNQRVYYQNQDKKIKKKIRGKPKRSKDHNLFNALWKYKKEILHYLDHQDVPFDNNQGERDLRMFKVKMKISNLFKSKKWMNVHAYIRSYVSTLKKNNSNIINNLILVFNNPNHALAAV